MKVFHEVSSNVIRRRSHVLKQRFAGHQESSIVDAAGSKNDELRLNSERFAGARNNPNACDVPSRIDFEARGSG
jgi:hypothetical protein